MTTAAAPSPAFFAHPTPRFDTSVVAPIPSHDRAPILKHHPAAWVGGPFHPHRPHTPTVRLMARDGKPASPRVMPSLPRHRPQARSSNIRKSIGQLLGREWMIEEAEEESIADVATIDRAVVHSSLAEADETAAEDREDEEDEEDEDEDEELAAADAGRAELEMLRSLAQRSTPTHHWHSVAGKPSVGTDASSLLVGVLSLPWPATTDEKISLLRHPPPSSTAMLTGHKYTANWAWTGRRHNSVGDVSMLRGARELREGMSR